MSKVALKEKIIQEKGNVCSVTLEPLPEVASLFDTHRLVPKRLGGEYSIENTNLAYPDAHMEVHCIYRERTPELDHLKSLVDDRSQLMKASQKINNQLRAYKRRTDYKNDDVAEFLHEMQEAPGKRVNQYKREIEKCLKNIEDPFCQHMIKASEGVVGLSWITMAYMFVYIDLAGVFPEDHPRAGQEKCRHASSLWAYAGLDKPSWGRYQKGVSGGGNKKLRTALYCFAISQRCKGSYRYIYDAQKQNRRQSVNMTKSYNTKGKLIDTRWCDTKDGHPDGHGMRMIAKHFMADYWFVGRTFYGLDTSPGYAEAKLGGGHRTVNPRERGWVF